MTKPGLLRMLVAALLQAASLRMLGYSGVASGPLLTQALSVDENVVPPHLQLPRPPHTAATDDQEVEVVDGVLALGAEEDDDDMEPGDREVEGGEGGAGVWDHSGRRLLMCKTPKCLQLPTCSKCLVRKGKTRGVCKRNGKKLQCRSTKPKKRGGGRKKLKKKGGRPKKVKKKGGRPKKVKKKGGRSKKGKKKGGSSGRKQGKTNGGRAKNKKQGGGGRKKPKKDVRFPKNPKNDGNEGNEGIEGDEGNEGQNPIASKSQENLNDNDEGNEGDEGDEGIGRLVVNTYPQIVGIRQGGGGRYGT